MSNQPTKLKCSLFKSILENHKSISQLLENYINNLIFMIKKHKKDKSSEMIHLTLQDLLTFLSLYSQHQKIQSEKLRIFKAYKSEIKSLYDEEEDDFQLSPTPTYHVKVELLTTLRNELKKISIDSRILTEYLDLYEDIEKNNKTYQKLAKHKKPSYYNSPNTAWIYSQNPNNKL
jgi:hypothetical protein